MAYNWKSTTNTPTASVSGYNVTFKGVASSASTTGRDWRITYSQNTNDLTVGEDSDWDNPTAAFVYKNSVTTSSCEFSTVTLTSGRWYFRQMYKTKDSSDIYYSVITYVDVTYNVTIKLGDYIESLTYDVYYTKGTKAGTYTQTQETAIYKNFSSTGYVKITGVTYTTHGTCPVTGYPSLSGSTWTIINSNGTWGDQYINIQSGSLGPTTRYVTISATGGGHTVKLTAGNGVSRVWGRTARGSSASEWTSNTSTLTLTCATTDVRVDYYFELTSGATSPYYATYNTSSGGTEKVKLASLPTKTNPVAINDTSFDRTCVLSATIPTTKKYKLTFYPNGGTGGPDTMESPSTTASSYTFTIPSSTPTRDLYKFLGWSTTSTGSVVTKPGAKYTVTSVDSSLYAVWEKNYLVTVKAEPITAGTVDGENPRVEDYFENGATWSINSSSKKLIFSTSATGQKLEFSPVANEGYKFTNWDKSGSGSITSDTTFNAQFDGVLVSAGVDLNGGKAKPGKEAYCKSRRVKYGEYYMYDYSSGTVQTLELPDASIVEKENYDFDYLENTTTGEIVTNTTRVSTITNHTLKVNWKRIEYKVSFNSTGGSPIQTVYLDESKDPQVILTDEQLPYRENYNFVGWKSNNTGNMYYSGSTILYSEEKAAFDATGHTLLLEAQWEPELAVKVTVLENGLKKRKQVSIKGGIQVNTANGWKPVTEWWTYTNSGWKKMVDNE